MVSTNVEKAIAALRGTASGDDQLEVARALEDSGFVVLHGRDGSGNGTVFFDVSRLEDGLIAERWTFTTPATSRNEGGHTQTDGPTDPDGTTDTEKAKAIVRDYYEAVHISGRHDEIGRYMSGNRQIRHEPGVRDGVAAFEQDLAMLTQSRTIDEIVMLMGQAQFVFIAARGTHEGRPCAYVDLYRVENDKLVEHWGFPEEGLLREDRRDPNRLL